MEMMEEFFAALFFVGGFIVLFPLVYRLILKAEEDQELKELRKTPINQSIYVRYPDHTIEKVQHHGETDVDDEDDVENALIEHLTNKLAAEPDKDVSIMLVCYATEKNLWQLRMFSVSKDSTGKLTTSTVVFGIVEFIWDDSIDNLQNPNVQLDALYALGNRIQDAV